MDPPKVKGSLVAEPRKAHQVEAMTALAAGMERHGDAGELAEDPDPEADFVALWGMRQTPRVPEGMPILYLENGYINGGSGDYFLDRRRVLFDRMERSTRFRRRARGSPVRSIQVARAPGSRLAAPREG